MMTEKELLYIEDVLSHEQILENFCSDISNEIPENDIKNFIIYLENKYQMHYNTIFKLLMK